jgi:hypothetical protein
MKDSKKPSKKSSEESSDLSTDQEYTEMKSTSEGKSSMLNEDLKDLPTGKINLIVGLIALFVGILTYLQNPQHPTIAIAFFLVVFAAGIIVVSWNCSLMANPKPMAQKLSCKSCCSASGICSDTYNISSLNISSNSRSSTTFY